MPVAHNDMKQAEQSYASFLGWVKWGAIATAIVTILVVLLITS